MANKQPIPAVDAALPRTSGGFRLITELGRGGMGVVYEAEELSSGRRVALKVLAEELAVSGEAYERFRREARIAAAISDSRCVFVYGAHEIEGSPAIAMELCGGETLEHRLTRKDPIPIETAVRWTLEILEGLEAAHASGIVHRDVKPSNCFTTEDGHVKIGDFGLSRSLERDVRLTQSGAFLGSPLYASPEQIRGREVDIRSDLYSCGATLYALLTGRPPYGGTNVGEVLARILSEPPPPPRSIRPEIPRALEKVVLRAMEREPEKRFKDHASFRAALQPFAVSSATPGGLLRRFLAYMLDSALLSIMSSFVIALCTSLKLSFAELDPDRHGMYKSGFFQLLLTALMALYFALFEGLWGAAPGKWLVGQRVLTVATNQTSPSRALLRTLVFFIATASTLQIAYAVDLSAAGFQIFALIGSIFGYGILWIGARKRNGWRGLHDFAGGMRVVQLPSPFSRFRRAAPPPAAPIAASHEWPASLGGYRVDGIVAQTDAGSLLQAHDPELDRSVWIQSLDDPRKACDDARRSLSRPARLRWLDRLEVNGTPCEVFEAPGGASLAECLRLRNGFDWPLMLRLLSSLGDELWSVEQSGGAGPLSSLDQLWVDRSWMLRVLDEPLRQPGDRPRTAPKAPIAWLGEVARLMLPSDVRPKGRTTPELPPDLPGHAESCARRILGLDAPYGSLEEARTALIQLSERPQALVLKTRVGQIALAGAFPILAALVTCSILWLSSRIAGGSLYTLTYISELVEDAQTEKHDAEYRPLSVEDRRARQILIARGLDNAWRKQIEQKSTPIEREAIKEAIELHPHPTEDEAAWAKAHIQSRTKTDPDPFSHPFDDPLRAGVLVGAVVSSIWSAFALIFAFAFRGGLSLTVFHVLVRDKRGRPASRLRCAARALAAGLPLIAVYCSPALFIELGLPMAAYAALGLGLLVHVAWIVHALLRPTRSLQDLVSGTRLVPR